MKGTANSLRGHRLPPQIMSHETIRQRCRKVGLDRVRKRTANGNRRQGRAGRGPAAQGLVCVVYQHPVPRNHLFWVKAGAAVVPLLAVAAGTLVFWRRDVPPDVTTALVYVGFAHTCAVLMALTLEVPIMALLASVRVVCTSLLVPMGFFGFKKPGGTRLGRDSARIPATADDIEVERPPIAHRVASSSKEPRTIPVGQA